MSQTRTRAMSARRRGLIFALAFALIAAGATLFFLFRGPRASSGLSATNSSFSKPPPTPQPPLPGRQMSGRARIEFADKADPSRKAGEMEWSSLEPLEDRGWSLITEPRAWFYLRDGKTIHIQAQKGRVYRSEAGREPESGRFEGAVVARLFEAGGGKAINLESDRPSILVYTDSMSFDTAKAELSTRDRVQISTADLEFAGTGMLAVLNQVEGRLESLEIDKGEYIRLARQPKRPPSSPSALAEGAAESSRPGEAGPTAVADSPTPPADSPTPSVAKHPNLAPLTGKEVLYRALFSGDVRLTETKRTLAADNLEVWARVINNKLPDGAIGSVGARAGKSTSAQPAKPAPAEKPAADTTPIAESSRLAAADTDQPQPSAPAAADKPAPQRTIAAASADTDILLSWTGTLVVRPLDSTPPELSEGNHVALRFTADKAGAVTLADEEAGVNGKCVWVGYAATTRNLTLGGRGPTGVNLNTKGGQTATIGRFDVNLATGIAHIPGGGVLEDSDRRITWNDQADMVFAMEPSPSSGPTSTKEEATGALREAAFTGNVVAKDKRSTLAGDFIKATFIPTAAKQSLLSRLRVEGKAVADAGDEGHLESSVLDVAFKPSPDGKEADPSVVSATGNFSGRKGNQTFSGSSLTAGLARGEAAQTENGKKPSKIIVTDLTADGANGTAVRFADADRNLSAGGDHLVADVQKQSARLTGAPGSEESAGAGGAFVSASAGRISAATIDLDGINRTLIVPGPGQFRRGGDTPAPLPIREGKEPPFGSKVVATWTSSMRFSDIDGTLDCVGNVTAKSDANPLLVDALWGERLRITLTPGSTDPASKPADTKTTKSPERQLLKAEVFAARAPDEKPGERRGAAIAERRRYRPAAAQDQQPELDQFLRVSGGQITYDAVASTVTVPGQGEAAVYAGEGVSAPKPERPAANGGSTPDPRGATLFTWLGSMSMDLATGLLDLRRSVTMFHRPLNSDPTTRIEAEKMEATIAGRSDTSEPATSLTQARGGQLVKAVARSAVYAQSGTRKLIADLLSYDALTGTSEATAAEDNRITIFDDAKGTSLSARRMFWDMVRDRVEIKEPSTIVVPLPTRTVPSRPANLPDQSQSPATQPRP